MAADCIFVIPVIITMVLKLHVSLIAFVFATFSLGQINDTLFYKSGLERVVEVDTFTYSRIKYTYINRKGDTTHSKTTMGLIKYFKTYSDSGQLEMDSRQEFYRGLPGKNQDDLGISKHTFSINPLALSFPYFALNTRYNYVFGKQMTWAINTRFTYVAPFAINYGEASGDIYLGLGLKFVPFYNERYSFGMDFTPTIGYFFGSIPPAIYTPVSLNFDLFFGKRLGMAIDFGLGPVFIGETLGVLSRSHFGLLWRFKTKKTIERPLFYHIMG